MLLQVLCLVPLLTTPCSLLGFGKLLLAFLMLVVLTLVQIIIAVWLKRLQ
nr:MAG TPA: hypothetical protein [Bacteriophage sp.]